MTTKERNAALLVVALLDAATPPERKCRCCGESINHRPLNALYCDEGHRRRHEEAKRRERRAEERARESAALEDLWANALKPRPCRCIPSGQVLDSALNGDRPRCWRCGREA